MKKQTAMIALLGLGVFACEQHAATPTGEATKAPATTAPLAAAEDQDMRLVRLLLPAMV